MTHERHHDGPVHGSGSAADRDEPVDATGLGGPRRESGPVHGVVDGSSLRAICIAVDDYGLHPGINQAALELAAAGRVNAIGCMVGGAAWLGGHRELVDLDRQRQRLRLGLHEQAFTVDLGLHLDLTETPGGPFAARPLRQLMIDCWTRRIDRRLLRAEIDRQLDVFEQAIGRPPDFVDGHQHVHQFPAVRDALVDALCERHTTHRPWLRNTRAPAWFGGAGIGAKAQLIAALGSRALAATARRHGFRQNHALMGVHGFSADATGYGVLLRRWFRDARHADLLMCHPSVGIGIGFDIDLEHADPIIDARLAEYAVLSGADFGHWLADAGIVLRPMSQLLASATVRHRG